MNEVPTTLRAVAFYRLLLWLYPAEFRRVYQQEMVQVFRDCYRDALTSRATTRNHPDYVWENFSIVQFWSFVVLDLVRSASQEHFTLLISFFKRLFGIEKGHVMSTLLSLDVAARTDIGRVRRVNEDNMVSIVPQNTQVMTDRGALFVVADGMGGHTKGDVASELAVNTVRDTYYHDNNPDIAASLQNALEQANGVVCQQNMGHGDEEKIMGTTCVAAVLKDDRVYVANAGDSLAYLVRGHQVMQLAENHSWVAEQIRTGAMSEAEARAAGKDNMIVRCLGTQPDTSIFVTSQPVQDKDILVLCTDGLHNLIGENEIRDIVTSHGTDEAAQQLIERANERGGADNITALVVRITVGV